MARQSPLDDDELLKGEASRLLKDLVNGAKLVTPTKLLTQHSDTSGSIPASSLTIGEMSSSSHHFCSTDLPTALSGKF